MEVLLASANAHKRDELARILAPHAVVLPSDLGLRFEAEETGVTYLENALIKARALPAVGGRAVLADDSGLSVPALGGEPGVRSARYGMDAAGALLGAAERNAYLLGKMEGLEGPDRDAFFVCCMALVLSDYRVFTAQETFAGRIAPAPSGSGGFGYDPVFFLPGPGRTVAELGEAEKDAISHRGRAGLRIKAVLDSLEAAP